MFAAGPLNGSQTDPRRRLSCIGIYWRVDTADLGWSRSESPETGFVAASADGSERGGHDGSIRAHRCCGYTVACRTRELAIRGALGATRSDLTRLVLRYGLALVSMGVVMGLTAGAAATRLMANLVYGKCLIDVPKLGAVAVLLMRVATLACWIPVRRVLAIEPLTAIRIE